MPKKVKIFISAYACEPELGSEIGVGWHWVLEMSQYYDLWVLTRESNRHTIEPWIAEHPEFTGIHFLYFDLPKWARFWKKGLRGVRTYYNIWQAMTDRIVKRTMQDNDIHVFHHLTYGNALWPVSDYGSRQTFIWGPIGGLETIPSDFSDHYSAKSKFIERLRRAMIRRAVRSRSLNARALHADLILCKTAETLKLLPKEAQEHAIVFTDVATDSTLMPNISLKSKDQVKCLVVGRLDAWRGFDLAIEAVAKAAKHNHDIHLGIIGEGVDELRLRSISESSGISDMVSFYGKVTQQKYIELMRDADIILNPALKEGAVTVSFDAMALGKPLVALDTTGYTRYFKPDFSIVIPRNSRARVIDDICDAILRLSEPSLRESMGKNAVEEASRITWRHHGEEIRKVIDNVIN